MGVWDMMAAWEGSVAVDERLGDRKLPLAFDLMLEAMNREVCSNKKREQE